MCLLYDSTVRFFFFFFCFFFFFFSIMEQIQLQVSCHHDSYFVEVQASSSTFEALGSAQFEPLHPMPSALGRQFKDQAQV